MHSNQTPFVKDLVLVGGGHSHVTVIKRFGMRPMPGVRVTVISRDRQAPYSGMLPGYIAGHYEHDEAHIDLGPLARFANARFIHDEVTGVDVDGKLVRCRDRPPVSYDVLSINIGSAPKTSDVPGARDFAVPVKPIDGFVAHWQSLRDRCLDRRTPTNIGVVGGGAGGVELVLAIQYRLKALLGAQGRSSDRLHFHLVTAASEILPSHNAGVRRRFRRVLTRRGIRVLTDHPVTRVSKECLHFAAGDELRLDEILWVTTAGSASWPRSSGFVVDDGGFIQVDATLQTLTHPDVFAVGDGAAVVDHPRPKAGVFAVRQGPPLERNLRRRLVGRRPRPFAPQREFLSLISTGDRYAVASKSIWSFEGRWVWRWKDWIDRRFMKKYNDLPDMETEERLDIARGLAPNELIAKIASVSMRCGGCGSKVGRTVLTRALEKLQPIQRPDVLVGLATPDDGAVVRIPDNMLAVQTADFFRAFVNDPFVFGKIAANHALSDIIAMGAEPQTAMAIVTVPFGPEEKVENELTQLMGGAIEVLNREHTALVGGHTSEGGELALGFAVNGLVDPASIQHKGGMRPGDKVVLTKALGTGVLFAADMRHRAKGVWIQEALESMVRSNRDAGRCLRQHAATAMTDVTGFGLLGHLLEMAQASRVEVEFCLDSIPPLSGALDVIGQGIFSSLQPENVRLRRGIQNVDDAAQHPKYPLIFDPQTAGGLLASVPAHSVRACIDELKRLGYENSTIVGEVIGAADVAERIRLGGTREPHAGPALSRNGA